MSRSSQRARGFTMIELMVTIAVLAILMTIAVPSFNNSIRRNDVSTASNALLADLSYARTEAVTRHSTVSMCPSTDGTSCASSTAYDTGWIIYTYAAGKAKANTAYDGSDAGNILLRYTQARSGVSIQIKGASVISYGQQGQLKPDSALNFQVCYRPKGTTGTGFSTTAVPGALLQVSGSGSVNTTQLGVQTGCTPA
ncbi:GspH/FimT family pseudopilin [Frateuria sp. Soil773]|uniref:GspH/FimT family pseudopilin n=1 Tax=Frateuria sp. Soil773 TaxID=1736407 RepID=UPI0012F8419B|nr:GspH/FimT family pseudopilin [Frateuria sp. Soil773]